MPTYLTAIEIDTLQLPSNPACEVRMKARATWGIVNAARSAALTVEQDTTGGPRGKAEWGAYVNSLTLGLIVDWNLTDDASQPLPITAENIDRLDPEDGEFLAKEAQRRVSVRKVIANG